jgi:hypothetical protein
MRRCKPGDLAVVVESPIYRENVGALVDVVRRSRAVQGEPAWECRSRGRALAGWCASFEATVHASVVDIADRCLRPIRPQPDDATDVRDVLVPAGEREGVAA